MSTRVPVNSMQSDPVKQGVTLKNVIPFAVFFCLMLLVLVVLPGRLDWAAGWAYLVIVLAGVIVSRYLAWRNNPDIVAERVHSAETVRGADRILLPLLAIVGPLALWTVVGLDQRYGWSPQGSTGVVVTGLVVVVLGNALTAWAMAENAYFSSVIRVQDDRGQTVCSTGPYRLLRHPGYAGTLAVYLVTPLALGSVWALIPALVLLAAMIVRVVLEEKTLCRDLAGYDAYTQQVRYRLVPGLW